MSQEGVIRIEAGLAEDVLVVKHAKSVRIQRDHALLPVNLPGSPVRRPEVVRSDPNAIEKVVKRGEEIHHLNKLVDVADA